MRRAMVTGADGFLGRHLVRVLSRRGVAVTALTRRPQPDTTYLAMGDSMTCAARLADIVEAAEPEAVFQLAGRSTGSDAELHRANVQVTTNLMRALHDAGVRPRLICCGSAAEYGAAVSDGVPVAEDAVCVPLSRYGASKLEQTHAALDHSDALGIPTVVARLFNVIGPSMPEYLALGNFAAQLREIPDAGVLKTGNLDIFRDFVDVELVAEALCKLALNSSANGIVNVCSGHPISLRSLVESLIETSGKRVTIVKDPDRVRTGELKTIVGSTARLYSLGAGLPATDHREVITRIWQHTVRRWCAA